MVWLCKGVRLCKKDCGFTLSCMLKKQVKWVELCKEVGLCKKEVWFHLELHAEEAAGFVILGDHLAVPPPSPHEVHGSLLCVELHVKQRSILPALLRLLLDLFLKNTVLHNTEQTM